jgi:peptidoglycan/LPS O-acetylase OafA/YrhL
MPREQQQPSSNRQTAVELNLVPELDGVRGIAILAVLLFHFGHVLPARENAVFGLGWAGVDLFFVLSGFLITRILWTTRDHPRYFVNFYGRRILRIFPLAFAFLASYFWVALPLAHHFGYDLDRSGSDQLWYWTYLANWHNGNHGSLTHLWSLSIEEQFYLIWPGVIFLVASKSLRRLCLLLVIIPLIMRFFSIAVFHHSVLRTMAMTYCRTDSLALGATVALSKEARILAKLVVPSAAGVLVIAGLRGGQSGIMGIYGLTLIAVSCAGFVQRVVERSGSSAILYRFLRSGWLRRFGKYSYAIYVLHVPLAAFVFHLYARAPSRLHGYVLFGLGIGLSYFAGWISWHSFESKILSLKRYFSYDQPEVNSQAMVLLPERN